jgi:Lamin Tail Domain
MRIRCFSASVVAAVGLAAGLACAQPVVFTQWNFNTLPPSTLVNSPAPSFGAGIATPLGMTNNYTYSLSPAVTDSIVACDITGAGGSTDTATTNNGWRVRGSTGGTLATAGIGWANQAPQRTQGARFATSTVNYTNIVFSYDWFTTNQGVRHQQLQYTLDGVNWTDFGPVRTAVTNGWSNSNTADFSSITAANNNPNFAVRMVSVYDPAVGGVTNGYTGASGGLYNNMSGNWRFDMVTFTGIPIGPVPPSLTVVATPAAVCAQGGVVTFTANTIRGAAPISTGLSVTADLSSLGLSATTALVDDGSSGDLVAGDGIFTLAATIPAGQSLGNRTIDFTISDAQARSGSATTQVAVGDCTSTGAGRVVISQVYGGGGNIGPLAGTDGIWDSDYVELFNRSNQTIDLTDWSVQYASPNSSGGFDNPEDRVTLGGVIRPGQYLLVRFSDRVPGFPFLADPDFAVPQGFGGVGNTGGRVALVRSTTLINANCADANIEDLVGYGESVLCFEGVAQAPAPSNPTAVVRKLSGAQDTAQNFNDFTVDSPLPRNRSAGGFLAVYPTISASGACAGTSVTITASVNAGSGGPAGLAVVADVSSIVGAPATFALRNDGVAPDQTAGDSIWTGAYPIPAGAAQGNRTITITASNAASQTDSTSLPLSVAQCVPSNAQVVISSFYGGGGNEGSGFNADFVEIFNRSSQSVDLTGWSVQYARVSDLGGFGTRIAPLSGTILPGQYKLLITNQPSVNGAQLPTPDFQANPTFGLENEFGHLALANTVMPLGTNFTSPNIIDFVGYGQLAFAFEGVAATDTLSNFIFARRKLDGCQDNNQNVVDFSTELTINFPRTGSSPFNTTCTLPQSGVCCRGATCATSTAAACVGANTLFVSAAPACNAPGNTATPCCKADFNKTGGLTVQDIFDFLNAWFAGDIAADFTGNGAGAPAIQSIFDFLNAWFAGC